MSSYINNCSAFSLIPIKELFNQVDIALKVYYILRNSGVILLTHFNLIYYPTASATHHQFHFSV